MKHARLYVYIFGLALLGIIAVGDGLAEAVLGVGQYYATPSWDQTVTCTTGSIDCPRFVVLTNMGRQAVLDKETGLVWKQSPSTSTYDWQDAQIQCNEFSVGGRFGWRLPTVQELASLIDPTQSFPSLPKGHPFSNVQSDIYWSATTWSGGASEAWEVYFDIGSVTLDAKSSAHYVWCVRGGQGVDPQ